MCISVFFCQVVNSSNRSNAFLPVQIINKVRFTFSYHLKFYIWNRFLDKREYSLNKMRDALSGWKKIKTSDIKDSWGHIIII